MLRAALDVAVTCFRPVGHDTERHQATTLGGLDCHSHGHGERHLVRDEMIGRQHQQQRVDSDRGSARGN